LALFLGALPYSAIRHGSTANSIQERKGNQQTVSGSISNPGPQAQDIAKEDRKFLDDFVQKQNLDLDGNPLSGPIQTIAEAGPIDSSPGSVPRAELVVNSQIVRRAELVVHSGKVKRQR
jgi:hypothetical protein